MNLSYLVILILAFLNVFVVSCLQANTSTTLLGEDCSINSTCSVNVTHSYCKKVYDDIGNSYGFCDCGDGYVSSRDLGRCLFANVVIGDQCEEDQQCVEYHKDRSSTSTCLPGSGICECRSGYIHSKSLRECLPIIQRLGSDECKDDAQCQLGKPGQYSECSRTTFGGVVRRVAGSARVGGRVVNEKRVCKCSKDGVDGVVEGKYENSCLKKAKKFGDSCKIQAQCTATLKNSICLHGKCKKR